MSIKRQVKRNQRDRRGTIPGGFTPHVGPVPPSPDPVVDAEGKYHNDRPVVVHQHDKGGPYSRYWRRG